MTTDCFGTPHGLYSQIGRDGGVREPFTKGGVRFVPTSENGNQMRSYALFLDSTHVENPTQPQDLVEPTFLRRMYESFVKPLVPERPSIEVRMGYTLNELL